MTRDQQWLLTEKYRGQQTSEFEKDCARLSSGEPVAYVIGFQPFLGLRIYLDSHPLIPRPETEWWTEELLKTLPAKAFSFLDLCAGSGAVGCAVLAHTPNAHVSFGDIDSTHEATIRKNVHENMLDTHRIQIRIGNLFEPFMNERFDFIAVNPPYVPEGRRLDASVTDWEPAQALYAGSDGLDIIRMISTVLPHHLAQGGTAWIECDSEHIKEAALLFVLEGFEVSTRIDQYGKPRLLVVSFSR